MQNPYHFSMGILMSNPCTFAVNIFNICSKIICFKISRFLFQICSPTHCPSGHLYHGRNLDFGLWPAFNFSDFQWELTNSLRDTLFNVNFTRNGKLWYRSTVFGGYIGMLTGLKKGAMTISVDTRFDSNYDKYLLKYLRNPTPDQQWLSLTTRVAIEDYTTYDDAVSFISKSSFIGPCYVIIGGAKKDEGAVLTVGPNSTMFDQWDLKDALPADNKTTPFYVLETNYDHWKDVPFFDDRRLPAEECMDRTGSARMNWESLYNVLHGKPNRNRLTTYTTLMDSTSGGFVAYKQHCTDWDCSPW